MRKARKSLLWRLGSFSQAEVRRPADAVFNPRFSRINGREHRYSVPAGWRKARSFRLPRWLTGDSGRDPGVETLVISTYLRAGFHVFEVASLQLVVKRAVRGDNAPWGEDVFGADPKRPYRLTGDIIRNWDEQVEQQLESADPSYDTLSFHETDQVINQPDLNFVIARVDGREMGCITEGPPSYALKGKDVYRLRRHSFAFFCEEDGHHEISVAAHRLPCWQDASNPYGRCLGKRFIPVSFSLFRTAAPQPVHTLKESLPAKPLLDLWGWESPIWYQRWDDPRGAKPRKIKRDAIDESFKRGANFLELYLSAYKERGLPIEWKEGDALAGRGRYLYRRSPDWDGKSLRALARFAHDRDFLMNWYFHFPYAPRYWEVPAAWLDALLRKLAGDHADALKHGWREVLDGIWFESGGSVTTPDLINVIRAMQQFNPGIVTSDTTYALVGKQGIWPGMFAYLSSVNRGPDDKDRSPAFTPGSMGTAYGESFLGFQCNCRVRQENRYGDTYPDWMLKLCNDYIRDYSLRPGGKRTASALFWISEADYVCHGEARDYVYGISQDPVRCAVSTRLTSTGRGGVFDQRKSQYLPLYYRRRDPHPASDYISQNNWFRLYVGSGRDSVELLYDPTGTAHYDSNSVSIPVSRGFLGTVSSAAVISYDAQINVQEPAGYISVLRTRARVVMNDPRSGTVEERVFTVQSDSPSFTIEVRRTHARSQQDMGLELGCEGYDRLTVDGKTHRGDCEVSPRARCLLLEDSRQLKPSLALHILKRGHVNRAAWQAGQRLVLWSENRKKYVDPHPHLRGVIYPVQHRTEEIRLLVSFLGVLYGKKDLKRLGEVLGSKAPQGGAPAGAVPRAAVRNVTLKTKTRLSNRTSLPVVAVAKVVNPGKGPYFVEEGGWWTCRGAQPCKGSRGDYLKLYLPARSGGSIHRYGLIDGVVMPGWGCQYTVALRDIKRLSPTRAGCVVRVMSTTPFLFAPRARFAKEIARVKLDGKDWRYFEGSVVFLPRIEGDYRLRVEYGKPSVPCLTRTHALVSEARWSGRTLHLRAGLPPWMKKLPRSLFLMVCVDSRGLKLQSVRGGEVVRQEGRKAMVRFKPGRLTLSFTR